MSLANDHFAPVVLERGVLRECGALDAREVGEPFLEISIYGVQPGPGVGGVGRGERDGDALVRLVAEVLMLEFGEAVSKQTGAGEQDNGYGGLHDDQDLL